MIMCSISMELGTFRSSWTSSIIVHMYHSLTVQYPIQRCGTAEGTNQHRTTRRSSAFDHTIFSNLISESKLDETLHDINYRDARNPWLLRSSWRGCTGKALILGKTLTIQLWSIRLDCDAAQVGYVHTIKKLSIILEKNSDGWSKVSAKYAPPSQIAPELGTESYFQIYADH